MIIVMMILAAILICCGHGWWGVAFIILGCIFSLGGSETTITKDIKSEKEGGEE